jgi:calcium permeable stress-gated cation channel
VAPEDERTDYVSRALTIVAIFADRHSSLNRQWLTGTMAFSSRSHSFTRVHNLIVHSTGKRRYGHPALTGVLPTPWLPLKKGQTLANYVDRESAKASDGNTVILTLRRRYSAVRKRGQAVFGKGQAEPAHEGQPESSADGSASGGAAPVRPLSTASTSTEGLQPPASHRLSFDPATGIITLPDGEVFFDRLENGGDSDSDYGEVSGETDSHEEQSGEVSPVVQGAEDAPANGGQTASGLRAKRHSTYFHHPERRRQVPGAFPA